MVPSHPNQPGIHSLILTVFVFPATNHTNNIIYLRQVGLEPQRHPGFQEACLSHVCCLTQPFLSPAEQPIKRRSLTLTCPAVKEPSDPLLLVPRAENRSARGTEETPPAPALNHGAMTINSNNSYPFLVSKTSISHCSTVATTAEDFSILRNAMKDLGRNS